jgi:hypothetical protein
VIEAWVTATVAAVGGGWAIMSGIHRRVSHVDTRLDRIELSLARDYVPRTEFAAAQSKIEEHMIRIEEKLDRMLERSQRI